MNETSNAIDKNYVVILRGPSGVGKSTISSIIQQKLGASWAVIDVDKFKHYMPLKEDKSNRAERTEIAHNVGNYFAKSMYDKGYSVILEEMYRERHNDQLVQLLETNGMRYIKLFLSAPLDALIQRSKEREKSVPEEETRRFYDETQPLPDDFVIDTSVYSSEQAADMIITKIRNGETI